ncbi:MAG: hypothetical protein K0M56_08480 [Kaistella sp.]|nr:hypothetical protein [Kaistella sp.]
MFAAIIYSFLDYEKLNADIVGEFILEEEYLQINTDQILYNEIKNFEIETNFYKGQLRFFGSSYLFQAFNYVGKNNFFKIQLNDQKLLEGEFQIESECDLKRINEKYASLLLNEKIHLYSHSLHKVPLNVKQTSSFLMYVIKLKEQEIIGKDYANRVLKR